jgi:hypothetical protein
MPRYTALLASASFCLSLKQLMFTDDAFFVCWRRLFLVEARMRCCDALGGFGDCGDDLDANWLCLCASGDFGVNSEAIVLRLDADDEA